MTPAEKSLLDGFLAIGFERRRDMDLVAVHRGWLLNLHAQVAIKGYRLDFVLVSCIDTPDAPTPFKVVIEVDGPEHDSRVYRRTDRERDRALTLAGCTVIRYTNEQALKEPRRHALDVVNLVYPLQSRHFQQELTQYIRDRSALGEVMAQ